MALLAPKTVSQRLNLSTSRLAQLDRAGVFPACRDSTGRRYWESDAVERFAAEREDRKRSIETAA